MAPSRLTSTSKSLLRFRGPDIDCREDHYRIGRGEQGVLICQPYKGELVGLWRFNTPDEAKESSRAKCRKFREYLTRATSWARTWLGNFYRGVSPVPAATRTTEAGRSMPEKITTSLNADG